MEPTAGHSCSLRLQPDILIADTNIAYQHGLGYGFIFVFFYCKRVIIRDWNYQVRYTVTIGEAYHLIPELHASVVGGQCGVQQ